MFLFVDVFVDSDDLTTFSLLNDDGDCNEHDCDDDVMIGADEDIVSIGVFNRFIDVPRLEAGNPQAV